MTDGPNWLDEFADAIKGMLAWRAEQIDLICALALLDGRYGVRVHAAGVRIDRDVPYGQIHYDHIDAGPQTAPWTPDYRLPDERDASASS